MLICDGYKMFHGTVRVMPVIRPDGTRWKEPFDLTGTWLYRPAWSLSGATEGCWYCKKDDGGLAESYPSDILSDFRDDADVG